MKKVLLGLVFICGLLLIAVQPVSAKTVKAKNVGSKNKKAEKRLVINEKNKRANLIDKLLGVAEKVGLDADQIEMVRYAIKNPIYFSSVFEHAAAQDYPFFALIGAVKVARNIKKLGFTQEQCKLPITIIDEVFSKADSTIDDAKGKQDTNTVVGVAKEYAANYAKAKTDSAKTELIAQLAKNIPYFGEIPVICSFAFETNLKIEKNLYKLISEKVKTFSLIASNLDKGNYDEAVALIIKLGGSADIACDFIDQTVSGGLIGRTPVLGKLAKGVCQNFAGKVFQKGYGLIKGGLGYAEDGVIALKDFGEDIGCAVISVFGNGCSSTPPPDPTTQAKIAAEKWCSNKGGLKYFSSSATGKLRREPAPLNTSGVEDSSLPTFVQYACNDGYSACDIKPGKSVCYSMTPAERTAFLDQRKKRLLGDLQKTMPSEIGAISYIYISQCPLNDNVCKNQINAAFNEAKQKIISDATANPTTVYSFIKVLPFQQAEQKSRTAVQEAEFRVLPAKWAKDFSEKWNSQCKASQTCFEKLEFYKKITLLNVSQLHKNNPNAPHSAASIWYADGEKLAINYFKTEFGGDKKDDDAERKQAINNAVMNATGREANLIELSAYSIRLKKGEMDGKAVYLDAVSQMNKYPAERTAMINRAYQTAMGRDAKPDEIKYWQSRTESHLDMLAASRNWLWSPGGAQDLRETVNRALQKTFPKRYTDAEINYIIEGVKAKKMIYSEIVKWATSGKKN